MKKSLGWFLALLSATIMLEGISGCTSFLFSDKVELVSRDTLGTPEFPATDFWGMAAFIYNEDIFFLQSGNGTPQSIPSAPAGPKTHIALSYAHDQIAYLDPMGNPHIIDLEGNELPAPSPSGPVKDIGWMPNDKALYMLVGNDVEFHGDSFNIPSYASSGFEAVSVSIKSPELIHYLGRRGDRSQIMRFEEYLSAYQVRATYFNFPLNRIRTNPHHSWTMVSADHPTDPSLGSHYYVNYWQLDLDPIEIHGNGMVPGPGLYITWEEYGLITLLRTSEYSTKGVEYDNLVWFRKSEYYESFEDLITYFPQTSNYVSIDWKP